MTPVRIVVCDERGAAAYDASLAPGDRVHLDACGALRSRWESFHERGRPDRLGQGPSANAVQRYADEHREPLEMSRRFARDVIDWIRREQQQPNGAGTALVAPPRFLGHLRELLGKDGTVELLRGEYRQMSPAQLATEPTIDALVRRRLQRTSASAAGAAGAD